MMAGDQGPVLKQCCCGCTLKTGTIIIGVLYLLGSLLELGNAWYSVTHQGKAVHRDSHFQQNLDILVDNKAGSSIYVVEQDNSGAYFITQAVFAGVQALAAVLLLIGANQERSGLILPWLVVEAIIMVVHGIVFIGLAVISFSAGVAVVGAIYLVGLLIYAALAIYFYLVIYSFYQTITERNNVRMV